MDTDTAFPKIPGYKIQSQLGEGGFAKVYLATQMSLGRDVALKIMDPTMANDRDFCERFVREGRDTATLSNHPDIVTIYDIGRTDDRYYIAMQYLPGANLKDLLEGDAPYQHPLHIVKRIAGALAYAHSKGFVHRDVKPANILFNEASEAVLSDFGIAKTINRNTQLTAVGSVIGTAAYMSPEQAKGLATIDGRSDLYSLGIVLYELLTRQQPYRASDPMSLMLKHVNDPVPQLPDTEQVYQPLINRLMDKDPNNRYQSGYEFLEDVEARFFTTTPNLNAATLSQTATPSRTNIWLGAGVAALALVVGSGFLLLDGPWKGAPSNPQAVIDNAVVPAASDNAATTTRNLGNSSTVSDITRVAAPASTRSGDTASLLSTTDKQRLDRLLSIAELHEAVGRITSPPGANAIEAYTLALELDPNNAVAGAALARLQGQ